jgi:hypothetical protein
MGQIALTSIPTFENLTKISTILGLDSDIDKDILYDELTETRPLLEPLVSHSQDASSVTDSVSQKWQKYFKSCTDSDTTVVPIPTIMFRIVSTALSVPGSNAFSERVFSLMNSKWRADRNRASATLIKSELQVSRNFGFKCKEFFEYAINDNKLLNAAASGQKYYWRRTPASAPASATTSANTNSGATQ